MLWTQSLYGHSIFALKRWQYPYVLFPRETPASSFVIMLLQVIVAHSVMCGVPAYPGAVYLLYSLTRDLLSL